MTSETSHPSLGPLPEGWEEGTNLLAQIFWTNPTTKIKTYYDPRKPNPHPDHFSSIPLEDGPLPEGWEIIGRTIDGRKDEVFLDHTTHTSTAVDPRLGPLPDGWELGRNSFGQAFWTNDERRIKTYHDPRKAGLHPGGFAPIPVEGNPLPEGWEVVGKEVDGKRVVEYLDHKNHRSTAVDPRG